MKKDYESDLSRHLRPVQAPDELWDRLQQSKVSLVKPRAGAGISWRWTAAAIATAAVVAGITLWMNRELTTEELAVSALSRTSERMDFLSADLAEIRSWMKTGTGLDLPLRGRPAPWVQLMGAKKLTHNGVSTVEIAYRVGDSDARLVISKAPPDGDGRHTFKKSGSHHGANFQSWTMRGQMYTIASSGEAKVGCMLCHNTGAPRMPALN